MTSNQLSGRRYNPGTPKVCSIPPEKQPLPPPPPPAWPDGWPNDVYVTLGYFLDGTTNLADAYAGLLPRTATPRIYGASLPGAWSTMHITWEVHADESQARTTFSVAGGTVDPDAGVDDWHPIAGWYMGGTDPSQADAMTNPPSIASAAINWP